MPGPVNRTDEVAAWVSAGRAGPGRGIRWPYQVQHGVNLLGLCMSPGIRIGVPLGRKRITLRISGSGV